MRLHLTLSPNQQPVPFTYQTVLTGALHKWLEQNELHNQLSLYSFSWLKGSRRRGSRLNFAEGARWFISAHDEEVARQLVRGILKDPEINFGMSVTDLTMQQTPDFSGSERFVLASPVLVKRTDGEGEKHFIYSDEGVDTYLTETLQHKLRKAGKSDAGVQVRFDRDYQNPTTKLVDYKGIKNRASMCPVLIEGTPEQVAFGWEVGVGNSTGIGFGALK